LTSDVNKKSAKIISETQAAWQQTTGYLSESGVQYVIHAVGPDWTNYENFSDCVSRIRTTIENTMTLAKNLTVDSIVFPVISGGIFCHSEKTLRDREQNTAQEILIQVIVEHVKNMDEKCELKNILIVEIDKVMCDLIKVKLKTLVESQSDKQTQKMRAALFNV
jgi:O-acetyl-ADP-ribose deacetylase (regulator of RNase III)